MFGKAREPGAFSCFRMAYWWTLARGLSQSAWGVSTAAIIRCIWGVGIMSLLSCQDFFHYQISILDSHTCSCVRAWQRKPKKCHGHTKEVTGVPRTSTKCWRTKDMATSVIVASSKCPRTSSSASDAMANLKLCLRCLVRPVNLEPFLAFEWPIDGLLPGACPRVLGEFQQQQLLDAYGELGLCLFSRARIFSRHTFVNWDCLNSFTRCRFFYWPGSVTSCF